MKTCAAQSLPDFIDQVLKIRRQWHDKDRVGEEFWYRGLPDRDFELVPGAYRRDNYDERSVLADFEQRVPSYTSQVPNNDWDWYFVAQHYRIPTRLLDWTLSPLNALFFALEQHSEDLIPCVWMMDAGALNVICTSPLDHAFDSSCDSVVVPGLEFSDHWMPKPWSTFALGDEFRWKEKRYSSARPMAVRPRQTEPRITAQKGMFTIHGSNYSPIEELFTAAVPEIYRKIARIDCEGCVLGELLGDLHHIGISRSTLFPDLESVAHDLLIEYEVPDARLVRRERRDSGQTTRSR